MFIPKRKQLFRTCSGRARELQRGIPAAFVFVLVVSAAAQDAGNPNQPGSTNPPPIQNIETPPAPPAVLEQLQAQGPLTNQFGVAPNQPSQLGPATLGAAQPTVPIMGTSAIAGPPSAIGTGAAGPGIPLWGPIDLHPGLADTFIYGNGIDSQPGQQSKTMINTVTPSLLFDLGKQWSLDYSPAFSYYSSTNFKNTVNESATLRGNWTTENWVLGLSQGYSDSTQPLIETGAQTQQTAYATALNASHQVSSVLSLDLGLNQNFRDAQSGSQSSTNLQGLTDLHEWTGNGWLNYQTGDMLRVGLGVILTYDKVDPGSDMPSEQIQGKINFHPGTKLTLTLSGGVEDRQFIGPSAPSLISPVFSGDLQYQVFQSTTFTLNASRTVTPSFFANEIVTMTAYNASIHQMLSKKISLDGSASYSTEPETSIVASTNLPPFFFGTPPRTTLQEVRNDTTTSFRVSLSYNIVERASLSVFYSISDNSSGQASFAYSSHQVGLSLSYRY